MDATSLQRAIGHSFRQTRLLEQALTHRSASANHNERLEFLGDGVLGCVIAEHLFGRFTTLAEGELSRLRATLVREETLFEIAQGLQLGEVLRLGEGELRSGGHRRPSILADALEAMIGAVFLDAGFDAARQVVQRLWAERMARLDPSSALKDPKTRLQEALQARRLALPEYALETVSGAAHAQTFRVACRLEGLGIVTHGEGRSRRTAEQMAAERAFAAMEEKR